MKECEDCIFADNCPDVGERCDGYYRARAPGEVEEISAEELDAARLEYRAAWFAYIENFVREDDNGEREKCGSPADIYGQL